MFPLGYFPLGMFPLGYFPVVTVVPINPLAYGPQLAAGGGEAGSYREDGNQINHEPGRY